MEDKERRFVESCGNVFADLGLANPDELLAKAELVRHLRMRIEELGLTQTEAGRRMGLRQGSVSRVVRGDTTNFSVYRLIRCLNRLGLDVTLQIVPAVGERGDLQILGDPSGVDAEEYAKAA